jgi:EAL domain-containing protein (putative c-di-GMP-specific phosphodiesterase class I)
VLAGCRALGVRFALDDFGTGYSSLAYFRNLSVDLIKIDQSFVRDMLDDPNDLGIVDSVVRMAQAFNRPVIAEGVETLEHGCCTVAAGLHAGAGLWRSAPHAGAPVAGLDGELESHCTVAGASRSVRVRRQADPARSHPQPPALDGHAWRKRLNP